MGSRYRLENMNLVAHTVEKERGRGRVGEMKNSGRGKTVIAELSENKLSK